MKIKSAITLLLAVVTSAYSKEVTNTAQDSLSGLKAKEVIANTSVRQEMVLNELIKKPYPKEGDWRAENDAFAAYHFNKKTQEADEGLIRVKNSYIDEMPHNAHWHVYLQARLYWLYSSKSPAPRMSQEAEDALIEMMYVYLTRNSLVTAGMWNPEHVWTYISSENHQLQGHVSAWSAAKILKDHPQYKTTRIEGKSLSAFAKAGDVFFKRYFKEKATKGLLSEVASPSYVKYSLNTLYNLYDFSDDLELKRLTGLFLNLYFADWAIEQFDGLRGGSKHRSYKDESSNGLTGNNGWFPFGLGQSSKHPGRIAAATTTWRPDVLVAELALAQEDRGTYEIRSRRPGLRVAGSENRREAAPEGGQLLRYTYHTPQFIMGTSMVPALSPNAWTAISSQNRINSILLNGTTPAKIFTQRQPRNNTKKSQTYNREWGVQDQGVMILQHLPKPIGAKDNVRYAQYVFFSKSLPLIENGGWVFTEYEEAYCAVKVVQGDATLRAPAEADFRNEKGGPNVGTFLELQNFQSPIVFEVSAKERYFSFEAFQREILGNTLAQNGRVVTYRSKAYRNTLTLYSDYSQLPAINGTPVDLNPDFVYQSPFINGNFGQATITISNRADKQLVLNFNEPDTNK